MKRILNSAFFAWTFAVLVFGSTAYIAYNTAAELHTTGTALIIWFL